MSDHETRKSHTVRNNLIKRDGSKGIFIFTPQCIWTNWIEWYVRVNMTIYGQNESDNKAKKVIYFV